jgi:hypothetical protein
MGGERNAYTIFGRKSEGNRPLENPIRAWHIAKRILKTGGCGLD